MPTRSPEREHLSKVLLAIARNSRKRGLLSGVAASVRRLFSEDERDVKKLLDEWGPNGFLTYLPMLARTKFRDRWREGMRTILADLVSAYDAEGKKQGSVGGAFDLVNPFLERYLDEQTMRLSGQVPETTRKNVEREVRDGLLSGESVSDIASRVKGVFETSKRSRAELIARTEANGAQNAASFLQAQASGVVTTKTWNSAHDDRVRLEHRHLDGMTIPLESEFPQGEGLWPHKPNCRCTLTFGIDLEEAATPEEFDPFGENVTADDSGLVFVNDPPRESPTEADLDALRRAYPEAVEVFWGEEEHTLREEGEGAESLSPVEIARLDSIDGLEDAFHRLGVEDAKVTRGNLELGKRIALGLNNLKEKGRTMPRRVRVAATPFKGLNRTHTPAMFSSVFTSREGRVVPKEGSDEVIFNPNATYWSDPSEGKQQFEAGFWASDDELAPIYHEQGHYEHYMKDPESYAALIRTRGTLEQFKAMQALSPEDVPSRYAMSAPEEFVAEVYGATMAGKRFSPAVMRVYEMLGGPDL